MSGAGLAEVTEENARLKALLAQTQTALADSEEARRRLEAILTDLRREKFLTDPTPRHPRLPHSANKH